MTPAQASAATAEARAVVDRAGGVDFCSPVLCDSGRQLRELADAMPQLVWIADSAGVVSYYNARVTDYGLAMAGSPPFYDWPSAIHPDDLAATWEEWRAAVAARRTYQKEHRVRMKDGAYRWHLSRGVPQRNGTGEVLRWFGAATDIHELFQLQQQQRVLIAELQHRTRNLMGIVRSIADKTIGRSADLADFRQRYGHSLNALSRAQDLLSRLAEGERITFDQLIRSELAVIDDAIGRVTLDGPRDVALRSSTVQILSLALHELATNAVKHGAFSQPRSRLEVQWSVERDHEDRQPRLHVEWRERGVEMPRGGSRSAAPAGS